MTLDDAIVAATGGPSVNEGLLAYYRAHGATSTNLMDAERQYLIYVLEIGDLSGSNQDLWVRFLTPLFGSLTFPVSLGDMQLKFWQSLIPVIP